MKRSIISYGEDCYIDCRPCEIEAAEDHFDDELGYEIGYNKKAGFIVGYNLKDEVEINQKAEETMKSKIVEDYLLDRLDEVDIEENVVRTTSTKNNLFEWAWDFTAEEEEYGCTLKCQGTVKIIKKQNPNPNIPKPVKKRKWATKAERK